MYSRLSHLGLCITQPTVNRLVRLCGKNHDHKIKVWKKSWEEQLSGKNQQPISKPCSYVIIGDNIDKNVSPRDMTVDHQVQSLHYFNSYAALDQVDTSTLSTNSPINSPDEILKISTSAILPTEEDCDTIRKNYIVLAAHVIAERIPYFKKLQLTQCVPTIVHCNSSKLANKSETVSS